jgi:HEAT repeat protein
MSERRANMASRAEIEDLLLRTDITDDDLRRLGSGAVPVLIDIFLHDTTEWNDNKRRMALHTLGLLGNERAVEFLIATAGNTDEEDWLRKAAIRSLGYAGHRKALDYLGSLLDHPDYDFKKSALMALAHSPNPESDRLIEQATGDERLCRQVARLRAREREDRGPDDSGEVYIV